MADTSSPRLVLVMNAKERLSIVRRAVTSCNPLIVGAMISVTPGDPLGKQLVEMLTELEIPHRVFAFARDNGGQMRSDLFAYAERHREQFQATHWLNVDADDELDVRDPAALLASLGDDPVYDFRELDEMAFEWRFPRLFRVGLGWTWRYPLHEVPLCRAAPLDPWTPPPMLAGVTYVRHTDTHSGPERFLVHAGMIESWLKLPGNRHDSRMRYYLGTSYRAAGNLEKALTAFEAHVDIGHACEMTWHSRYSIARCMEALDRHPESVIAAYERAIDARPWRAEPQVHLARFLRTEGLLIATAREHAQRAANLPKPEGDVCFVETDAYAWRAADELAMCFATEGDGDRAAATWRALLASGRLPDDEIDRVATCLAALAVAA